MSEKEPKNKKRWLRFLRQKALLRQGFVEQAEGRMSLGRVSGHKVQGAGLRIHGAY